jgi:Tfp pilus assembly protein PilF
MARPIVLLLAAAAALAPLPAAAQRIKLAVGTKELESRMQKDSLDPAAHYNVALAYWNEKRFDDAERELKLATEMYPRFAEAYLALAFLPYARRPKLWDDAAREHRPAEVEAVLTESDRLYRRAFLINPLVDMRIIGATTPPKSAGWDIYAPELYDFYFQAFDDMRQGKYEEAYGRFSRMHRERRLAGPGQGKLPLYFIWFEGLAAAHTQRYEEAGTAFEYLIGELTEEEKKQEEKELLRVPIRTNEYRYFLATVRQAAGLKEEALKLYQTVLENDLGVYMAHVQMAGIYEALHRYPDAIEERRRAVDANPDDPSLLTDLGVTLGKAGQLEESEQTLQQAALANPHDPRSVFWLGICQVQRGEKDAARGSLSRFVATAPSRWEKQITLANQHLASLQ